MAAALPLAVAAFPVPPAAGVDARADVPTEEPMPIIARSTAASGTKNLRFAADTSYSPPGLMKFFAIVATSSYAVNENRRGRRSQAVSLSLRIPESQTITKCITGTEKDDYRNMRTSVPAEVANNFRL
jgi:hypothetical protein